MKKLSIIRFKPKPECFDAFLSNIVEFSRDRGTSEPPTQYLMVSEGEIYAIIIRDADTLAESAQSGVGWLDSQRHLLQEYNEVDRHTLPTTGDLIEY
ncbi:MAG: hypothetical protein EVA88_03930 [Rhodospirillaceae bacterium]|nr:MAG: hypothetical protein EVA88_03930 [Rhodospirillaceae bacterium]